MKIVLDASAALTAVLSRPGASAILEVVGGASVVIAPDLFASEVANALWRYVSAGELDATRAAEDLDASLDLVDRLVPVATFAQEALREATGHKHPVYDLCYAIAARREGCAVLTVDARLQKLLAKMNIEFVPLTGRR